MSIASEELQNYLGRILARKRAKHLNIALHVVLPAGAPKKYHWKYENYPEYCTGTGKVLGYSGVHCTYRTSLTYISVPNPSFHVCVSIYLSSFDETTSKSKGSKEG